MRHLKKRDSLIFENRKIKGYFQLLKENQNDLVVEKLNKVLNWIFKERPFYGIILSKLFIYSSRQIKTMATDSKSIIFNPDFVLNQKPAALAFVILHELMHCINQDPKEGIGKNHELWNYATDYSINPILTDDKGFGSSIIWPELPNGERMGLYEEKYVGSSSLAIYKDLFDQMQNNTNKSKKSDSGDDSGNDSGDDSGDEDETVQEPIDEVMDELPEPEDDATVIRIPDELKQELEEEGEEGDEQDKGEEGDEQDKGEEGEEQDKGEEGDEQDKGDEGDEQDKGEEGEEQDKGEDKKSNNQEQQSKQLSKVGKTDIGVRDILKGSLIKGKAITIKEIKQSIITAKVPDWKNVVNQAINQHGQHLSKLQQEIIRKNMAKKPLVDWREKLREKFDSRFQQLDWKLGSKKYLWNKQFRYSVKNRGEDSFKNVICAVDTSGSIGKNQIKTFLNEVEYLWEEFQAEKLVIIYCDDRIQNSQILTRDSGDKVDYNLIPQGGLTAFEPPFQWVEKNIGNELDGNWPSLFIYLTDTDATMPNPNKYGLQNYRDDVIWFVCSNIIYNYPPFGEVIHIELSNLMENEMKR